MLSFLSLNITLLFRTWIKASQGTIKLLHGRGSCDYARKTKKDDPEGSSDAQCDFELNTCPFKKRRRESELAKTCICDKVGVILWG